MSYRSIELTEQLYKYLLGISREELPILKRLREETASFGSDADMQISPEQGQFMGLLVRISGARQILEIGTFTGYSSLCMAMSLPPYGRVVTCDISKEWTTIAQQYWKEARVEDRIELHLGTALNTLDGLLAEGNERRFDMVFIDADKENNVGYFEYAMKLVRPGGLVIIDNILWGGKVIEPEMQDRETVAIRAFNEHIKNDKRITFSVIPLADGLTLAVRN
jgi:predicted O-methyltransferase YrrM